MRLSWIYLTIAIVLETAGTVSMKYSDGFTRILPTALIFIFYAASFYMMTLALRELPLSVVYAIWSGVGTALLAIFSIIYFGESISSLKVISLALIIFGVIGLRLGEAEG